MQMKVRTMLKAKQNIIQSANFKRDYVAYFAVISFFVIFVGELILAVSIPAYLSHSSAMAKQVRRIRLMDSFDSVRYLAARTKPKNDNAVLEKNLIVWELDKLANYMRVHQKNLSSKEVAHVQKLVDEIGGLLGHLKNGQAFSKAIRLDTGVYVKSILKQREEKL